MAKTRYAPDRGLTTRMTLTMFLLGLVFVAFIVILVYLLSAFGVGSGAIAFFAILLGAGLTIGSFFYSDKIALSAARAVEVGPNDGPMAAKVHGIVDRLCALADMPKPRVAIARSPMPNAFATGRNAKKAVLCVTTSLMDGRLDDRELEGVIAHEMSHVAHKDVAVMTIASFLGIIAGLLVRFAFYGELFGGGGGRGGGNNNNNGGGAIVLLVMLAVGIVVYAVSFLLIRLLSRYRELAADRAAVRPGQRADQGERRDRQDPAEGPAPGRAAERLLLRARAVGPVGRHEPGQPVLHAPVAGEAAQAAVRDLRAARAVAGGISRHAARPDQAGPAEAGRPVRDTDRRHHPAGGDGPGPDGHRLGVLPGGGGPRVQRHREGRAGTAQHGPGRRAGGGHQRQLRVHLAGVPPRR